MYIIYIFLNRQPSPHAPLAIPTASPSPPALPRPPPPPPVSNPPRPAGGQSLPAHQFRPTTNGRSASFYLAGCWFESSRHHKASSPARGADPMTRQVRGRMSSVPLRKAMPPMTPAARPCAGTAANRLYDRPCDWLTIRAPGSTNAPPLARSRPTDVFPRFWLAETPSACRELRGQLSLKSHSAKAQEGRHERQTARGHQCPASGR